MLGGGILCERRHSEATPAMKPSKKLSVPPRLPLAINAGTNFTHATGSVPISLLCPLATSSSIVLKLDREIEAHSEEREYIEHTGKCVRIGGGKYEFCDTAMALLGRGSYGIVFRGICLSSRQPVAVKRMLHINVRPDELEAMKCGHNDNLVALLDVCDDNCGEISYLVMELCDTDLDRHLRAAPGGKLAQPDLRVLVANVVHGYFALFEKCIVHRDIKPQNILLLYGPQSRIRLAKITDFGVSRVLTPDENMGLCNVAGTLLYMAPEVGANVVSVSEYDHSADMWSMGCLLFQCLTGRTPFDEASLCRLFLQCAGGNFDGYELPTLPSVDEKEPTLELVHSLIHSLLQIDRDKRMGPPELLEAIDGKAAVR